MTPPEKVEQHYSLLRTRNINSEALACLLAAFESTDDRVKDSVSGLMVFMKLVDPEACNKKHEFLASSREMLSDMMHQQDILYRHVRSTMDLSDDKFLNSVPPHCTITGLREMTGRLLKKDE